MRIGPVVKTIIPTTTYNGNTTVDITDKLLGVQWVTPPVLELVATEVNNGTTLDVDVNTSFNAGANYNEVLSFTQRNNSGRELKAFTVPPWGGKVQAELTFGAAGNNWTVALVAAGMAMGGSGS